MAVEIVANSDIRAAGNSLKAAGGSYNTAFFTFDPTAGRTQIGHWFNQLARKAAGTVTLLDDRDQIVFNEFASSIADQTLFIRKLGVEFEEINSPEPDSHELPASVSRRE